MLKANPLIFVTTIVLAGCADSAVKTNTTKVTENPAPSIDNSKSDQDSSAEKNCDALLLSLVKKSSFNPDIKRFDFKVWVDEIAAGATILKITMKNTERNEG